LALDRKIELLRQTVAAEEAAIRTQKLVAVGACAVGVVAAAAILLFAGAVLGDRAKWALSVCATLIAMGGGSLSLRDVPVSRRRIAALTYLEREFAAVEASGASAEQVKELDDHFRQVLARSL
jgi:hypothetical protein